MLQSVEQGPKKSAEENEKNKNITLRDSMVYLNLIHAKILQTKLLVKTDQKTHQTRIKETRTEHFYKHKPKNLQLPRRHPKPHRRNLLSIQKAQQRNSLHHIIPTIRLQ